MGFESGETKSLSEIRNEIVNYKFQLRIIFFSITYFTILVLLFLKVLTSSLTTSVMFSYIFPLIYIFIFYIVFPIVWLITTNKKRSYLQYTVIQSFRSLTISDLRYDIVFNSVIYITLYSIISGQVSLNNLLLDYLLFLIILLVPYPTVFIAGLLFNRRFFDFLEYVIFNDAINDIKGSVRIKVWTGSGIFEGEIKNIEDELVIFPLSAPPKDYEIHIRWESIQAFEAIEK